MFCEGRSAGPCGPPGSGGQAPALRTYPSGLERKRVPALLGGDGTTGSDAVAIVTVQSELGLVGSHLLSRAQQGELGVDHEPGQRLR